MRALVTGAAGFIGSHLAEGLVAQRNEVVGVDSFTPYYARELKESNLRSLRAATLFELVEDDLMTADLAPLLRGVDVVFHQAAQPGVRLSWSDGFDEFVRCNVLATQRLLEASKDLGLTRFVYASSSSIYGNDVRVPTTEADLPAPHSPYGVTKLAGEHLCGLYAANWNVPTIALRYFTVFGPRQRPDMALHRLIESGLSGEPFTLYGSGDQVRDFTYVSDVVAANLASVGADVSPGTTMNVAGGGVISMNELIALTEEVLGRRVNVKAAPPQPGDVDRTGAAIDHARVSLNWKPEISTRQGVEAQLEWHRRGGSDEAR